MLRLRDSIKLNVTLVGTEVEHEYILIRQRLEDIKPYLAKGPSEVACTASRTKKSKRKLNSDEMEPSTSFKSKPYALPQTSHRASPVLQTSPGRDQGTGGGRAQHAEASEAGLAFRGTQQVLSGICPTCKRTSVSVGALPMSNPLDRFYVVKVNISQLSKICLPLCLHRLRKYLTIKTIW